MSLQEVMDQQKKAHGKSCNLYLERVRSIKTVLFFIVSMSLLSGETVPTCINNNFSLRHLDVHVHCRAKLWVGLLGYYCIVIIYC